MPARLVTLPTPREAREKVNCCQLLVGAFTCIWVPHDEPASAWIPTVCPPLAPPFNLKVRLVYEVVSMRSCPKFPPRPPLPGANPILLEPLLFGLLVT